MNFLKKEVVTRFLKFGVVGTIGYIVSFLVLNFLMLFFSHPFIIRVLIPVISAEVALLFNYALYHHWVWVDRSKETRREYWVGFVQYNLGMGLMTLVSIGLMNILVEWFTYLDLWQSVGPYVSGIWADPIKFYVNLGSVADLPLMAILFFLFADKFIFKKRERKTEK